MIMNHRLKYVMQVRVTNWISVNHCTVAGALYVIWYPACMWHGLNLEQINYRKYYTSLCIRLHAYSCQHYKHTQYSQSWDSPVTKTWKLYTLMRKLYVYDMGVSALYFLGWPDFSVSLGNSAWVKCGYIQLMPFMDHHSELRDLPSVTSITLQHMRKSNDWCSDNCHWKLAQTLGS